VILDIDHHLDPRQMGRQRPPVDAALGSTMGSFSGLCCLGCCVAACRDLLDLFEPQQQLIFRQGLGAPAEPITAQLIDDLFQR
jgi:hypothetical protein